MPKTKNEQVNKDQSFIEEEAKAQIRKRASESLEKGYTMFNLEDVEAELKKQEEERSKAREQYYKQKAEKSGTKLEVPRKHQYASDVTVYKAKAALKNYQALPEVKEGAVHRTIRLIKGLRDVNMYVKANPGIITNEKKRLMKKDVFTDAWGPVTEGATEMSESLWSFLTEIWEDFVDILLFVADFIIKIWYYLGSFILFIWDWLWDLRVWFDEHKKGVFQVFSGLMVIIAVSLIGISSMSGYEYSYYGRVLGVTRSKQEVYQTIEALGDKLSEASGANINLDVERDIEFKKVYGFNIEIDNADDILSTLTYMKDIQVRAFAICLDGVQKVILENDIVAQNILDAVQNYYAAPSEGVEYTSIVTDQVVTKEEVGVQLGDIWNPTDAYNYLLTGQTDPLEEGQEANPLITMKTTETVTYFEQVKFGIKYIENASIYADETELISSGVYGKNEIVAVVDRVNGEEVSRKIVSQTRILNPINAVYYKGTKPIPEKKGTGTFIYPIKSYNITSRFGSRNTGIIGASTYHKGVDFGAPTGTKIYASDGGTVTFAGWQPSYGYVVVIDHGGLFESRYAHCSKLIVSKGDKVYQGQYIANVGSTGVSSGPHLHFEILYKDVAYNPLPYLQK